MRSDTSKREHVLYRFFDQTNDLLYVGITCSVPKRFGQHRDTKEWWPQIAAVRMEHFNDRASVLAAERAAVAAEKPKYNIHLQGGGPGSLAVPDDDDEEPDRAVGLWFHSVEEGAIKWQGQVLDAAGAHGYRLQLYSWLDGSPTNTKLVTHEEMQGWRFYPTDELMRAASYIDRVAYPSLGTLACPRCEARGEVFRPKKSSDAESRVVIWRRDGGIWIDLLTRDPSTYGHLFGCGHCPPEPNRA